MTCECLVGAKCDHERRCDYCNEVAVEHDVMPKDGARGPDSLLRAEDLCEWCLESLRSAEVLAKRYDDRMDCGDFLYDQAKDDRISR